MKEVLLNKKEQTQRLLTQYLTAFSFFILLNGGLLKFSFDKNATPDLAIMLSYFGAALSVIGICVCFLGLYLARKVQAEINSLSETLSVAYSTTDALPLTLTSYVALAFSVCCLTGWILLIIRQSQP